MTGSLWAYWVHYAQSAAYAMTTPDPVMRVRLVQLCAVIALLTAYRILASLRPIPVVNR